MQFESIIAVAGRGIYIPLVPPEARAAFHYALASFIERKAGMTAGQMSFVLLLLGCWITMVNNYLNYFYGGTSSNMLLYPFGIDVNGSPAVADYMPLVPWLGVFLVCAAAGRLLYKDKKTLFTKRGKVMKAVARPVEFIGRHSLIIYLVHQPVIYGILYAIFLLINSVK